MTQKHNLDSAGAANAVVWADDVDDTVNRLTGLYLGRLTNVASGNAINGRLPMSSGFTGIATGARFSFVCAGDTTSAVTMQLKDTAGTNVGSSFALRQPNGSAFDATTFLNGGVLYTFEYDGVDGYARQVAIVEQAIPATTLYGWQYLEKQEPTSDVGTITFATYLPGYQRQADFEAEPIPGTLRPLCLLVQWRSVKLTIYLGTGRVAYRRLGRFSDPRLPTGDFWVTAEDLFRLKLMMACAHRMATSGGDGRPMENSGFVDALEVPHWPKDSD